MSTTEQVRELLKDGSYYRHELRSALDRGPGSVSYALERLNSEGVLNRDSAGRYYLNDKEPVVIDARKLKSRLTGDTL